ncbi:unnamed protein product [Toxocara canis]|uniref:Uncharacterized protein n=1 Tax=Toxocara canis TaxID=6265 RepID=A0A183VCB7_TOXCA|nr:unnamed protein product [Toxocara canis]
MALYQRRSVEQQLTSPAMASGLGALPAAYSPFTPLSLSPFGIPSPLSSSSLEGWFERIIYKILKCA